MLLDDIRKWQYQLIILGITLGLYVIVISLKDPGLSFVATVLGMLMVLELITFVGFEVTNGAKSNGWKHEIVDTIVAIIAAIVVWFALCFFLNTSSPISAVASCSMLPNLGRGDMLLVQGAPIDAYELTMTPAEFAALSNIQNTQIKLSNGSTETIRGSLFSTCYRADSKNTYVINTPLCTEFHANPSTIHEIRGPLEFEFSSCAVKTAQGDRKMPCVTSVTFKDKRYIPDLTHDIVVYQPQKNDLYRRVGDIVHRAYFKISVTDGSKYYLTKGDNNNVFDIQVFDEKTLQGNAPVPIENTKGKIVFSVPYLGYVRLFLGGIFQDQPQCFTQLTYPHA